MKRWGTLRPAHFDKKELKTNLGEGNFIFIGSSIDIFGDNIQNDWIQDTLTKAIAYNNKYLLQTKNPFKYHCYLDFIYSSQFILSTTIETNRFMGEMKNSPAPKSRAVAMKNIPAIYRRMVTIEPIMKFDLMPLVKMVLSFSPEQINIGADSGNNNLWEPSEKETVKLIEQLKKYTTVVLKPNLSRIIGGLK
jgi:hypothetical protein